MAKSEANKSDKQARRTRTSAQLPVRINRVRGVTRDVSSSGMYIVQSKQHEVGSRINFFVNLDTPEGKLKLSCEGEVVRVEEVDGKVGIGVRILSQKQDSELNSLSKLLRFADSHLGLPLKPGQKSLPGTKKLK